MKKLLFVLAISLLALNVYALDEDNSYVGMRVGGGLSYFSGSDWDDALGDDGTKTAMPSISIGLYYNAGIIENISIETGLNFFYGGGGYTVTIGGSDYSTSINYSALELPVLAKYSLGMFDFFIGPEFTYIIGDFRYEYSGGDTESIEPDSTLDMGIHMGAEAVFKSGLTLGFNFMPTFTGFGSDDDVQANIFRMTLGYHFQ